MSLGAFHVQRSVSPASSGRASPSPRVARRAIEENLYKTNKSLRRYGTTIERALSSWENAPEEWADYIAFLSRLLKAIQSHPSDHPFLPHCAQVTFKLAKCLNPALPSGVHQKALEVYTHVFQTFGQDFLAAHLLDFLPGLSGVLAFASLSVRPAVYDIYEEHILRFTLTSLRPALKSLILSLLPAVEEETSEDFDRAFGIIESLQTLFTQTVSKHDQSTDHGGFFWQCIFLCVITSPSRRQGAYNYLVRKMPKAVEGKSRSLPRRAEGIVAPEPGLLVRAFVSALSDPQPLVQRNFLDLLISHLPLHADIFDSRVEPKDLDRLITAVTQVLLRRDMSMNRRIWSWFLGPQPKDETSGQTDAVSQNDTLDHQNGYNNDQFQYFLRHGRAGLERTMLASFNRSGPTASDLAKAFRICLSLMDRWEIGGSIVPRLFPPAMQAAFEFSQHASTAETMEVLRSANLFFDGIEARLIWSNFIRFLKEAMEADEMKVRQLQLLDWICRNFNIKDEEMVTTHVPYAAIYVLCRFNLRAEDDGLFVTEKYSTAFLTQLLEIIAQHSTSAKEGVEILEDNVLLASQDICDRVEQFYDGRLSTTLASSSPIDSADISVLLLDRTMNLVMKALHVRSGEQLHDAVSLLVRLNAANKNISSPIHELIASIRAVLPETGFESISLDFEVLNSISTLVITLHNSGGALEDELYFLQSRIISALWPHLSPENPAHHVEVVNLIWRLDETFNCNDSVKISLLSLIRGMVSEHPRPLSREECLRRFAILWNHTVPAHPANRRKRSTQVGVESSAPNNIRRQAVLREPLLLALDSLADISDSGFETTKNWLLSLPSLPTVVEMLIQQLISLHPDNATASPDPIIAQRQSLDRLQEQGYILSHVDNLLKHVTQWTLRTLCDLVISVKSSVDNTAIVILTDICCQLLINSEAKGSVLNSAVAIIASILSNPTSSEIDYDSLDMKLVHQLERIMAANDGSGHTQLVQLAGLALKLRHARSLIGPVVETEPKTSLTIKRQNSIPKSITSSTKAEEAFTSVVLVCLQKGVSSSFTRPHLDQWLTFLARALPTISDILIPNLIPLVARFCAHLEKAFSEVEALAQPEARATTYLPDATIVDLFEGLEMILARAHENLLADVSPEQVTKTGPSPSNFFGAVTTSVFKGEGSMKAPQNNNRLTVVLAFQDCVRIALKIWRWASYNVENRDAFASNIATISHSALKIRNKTRLFLENIFAAEPLEALEVVIYNWRYECELKETDSAMNLLHTMNGATAKLVLHTILDSLCSRANPSAVPPQQISSQAIELSSVDIAIFLIAYVESMDDDATEEIWNSCIAFLRDMLSNPLPYRQVLLLMLKFVLLLAQKLDNTNYGEPRKMRKELGDVFQRLLTATFTTMSTSQLQDALESGEPAEEANQYIRQNSPSLLSVFVSIVTDIETILESNDKVTTAINSISTNVLSPIMHAKVFPANVHQDALALFLQVAKKAPHAKTWKKELSDAFFDARFFSSKLELVEHGWFPVLNQWALRDRERMSDLLSKLTAPSSAGIMFGVGASAARLEADRRTQLNLRRIGTLLLASPEDTYVALMPDFQVKLVELFEATHASSPSSVIKAELFMVLRALLLSISSTHVASLWPIVNESLQGALSCVAPEDDGNTAGFTNLSLVQACKLLDLLVTTSPDEFQLHEWLYITDTVDAVYHPSEWMPTALSDRIAESLGASNGDEGHSLVSSVQSIALAVGKRRPLLRDIAIDKEDLKALSQEECARLVLRPFLSQLSILAYEGVYSMEEPDFAACRHNLLEDVLDVATMIE